jgi:hypothetical protein
MVSVAPLKGSTGRQKGGGGIPKKYRDFAHLIVAGLSQEDAYKQAISATAGHNTARTKGCVIANEPRMKEYIKELREASWTAQALSYAEKRAYLADVVRTPVGKIDEHSPLAQEVIYEETKYGTTKKIKMVSKTAAIAEDSKLAGDYYSDKAGLNMNPFGWLISMSKGNNDQIEDSQKVIEIGNGSIPVG